MKTYLMAKNIVEKILYYIIKFDILLVYSFSRTPFFVIYLLLVLLGVFGGESSHRINIYLLLITCYIIGLSIVICIVCQFKTSYNRAKTLLGDILKKKYASQKGITNSLILHLPIIIFLIVEIWSFKYQVSLKHEKCDKIFQTVESFEKLGDLKKAHQMLDKMIKTYESIPHTRGFISQLPSHPFMLQIRDILSKIFGL